MSRPPKHATELLATIVRCPGMTARGLAADLGLKGCIVYAGLRWLEAHGDIERDESWPAGWSPVYGDDAELDMLAEAVETFAAVEALLDEAMSLPAWPLVPRDVQHKIEHAKVELMRSRGEIG